MKKTKFLIFIFGIMLAVCIFGAVKMLMITKNQKIDDFTIETVKGYDSAAMKDVLLDVDYEFYPLNELNLQYCNGEIINQKYSKKESQVYPVYEEAIKLSEDKILAFDDEGYTIIEKGMYYKQIHLSCGDMDSFCEDDLYQDSKNAYVFTKGGLLYKLPLESLRNLVTEFKGDYNVPVSFIPIFRVSKEVETIVGVKVGDVTTVVGVGDIGAHGYTLYVYAINRETGEILSRETVNKERKSVDNAIIGGDLMSIDLTASNKSMNVVTVMDAGGHQDMYIIEWDKDTMECEVSEYDVTELLGADTKICGMFDLEYKDGITYICYAEGVTGEVVENEKWAKRNIADIQSVGFYSYENKVGVNFNGVAIIAIEDNAVIYKGYLSSESYKERSNNDMIITSIRMSAS